MKIFTSFYYFFQYKIIYKILKILNFRDEKWFLLRILKNKLKILTKIPKIFSKFV